MEFAAAVIYTWVSSFQDFENLLELTDDIRLKHVRQITQTIITAIKSDKVGEFNQFDEKEKKKRGGEGLFETNDRDVFKDFLDSFHQCDNDSFQSVDETGSDLSPKFSSSSQEEIDKDTWACNNIRSPHSGLDDEGFSFEYIESPTEALFKVDSDIQIFSLKRFGEL